MRDALTRAHNRRYLVERLGSEIAYARRHVTHLALIMFDLDHFKRVNDTHGHLAGDEVLREVAALVSRLIRAEDVFARFGGEEFVVLVRGIEHDNATRFAERMRSAVERLEVARGGHGSSGDDQRGRRVARRARREQPRLPRSSSTWPTSAFTRPRAAGETA